MKRLHRVIRISAFRILRVAFARLELWSVGCEASLLCTHRLSSQLFITILRLSVTRCVIFKRNREHIHTHVRVCVCMCVCVCVCGCGCGCGCGCVCVCKEEVSREISSDNSNVFNVVSIGAEKAFDPIKAKLEDEMYKVKLTTCDANRHIEIIERIIRFMTERIQVVRFTMPYKTISKRLTIERVHRVIILMNSLPRKGTLHSKLSPRKVVTRNKFRCPTIRIG